MKRVKIAKFCLIYLPKMRNNLEHFPRNSFIFLETNLSVYYWELKTESFLNWRTVFEAITVETFVCSPSKHWVQTLGILGKF